MRRGCGVGFDESSVSGRRKSGSFVLLMGEGIGERESFELGESGSIIMKSTLLVGLRDLNKES